MMGELKHADELTLRLELWGGRLQREGHELAAEAMTEAADEIEALRARVAELEGALRPFAQMLERYDLDLRPLITVSHADVWRAARAALTPQGER